MYVVYDKMKYLSFVISVDFAIRVCIITIIVLYMCVPLIMNPLSFLVLF